MSRIDKAGRMVRLSEAYLGHRLSRAQLQNMLGQVELPEKQWNDTFERLTSKRVEASEQDGPVEPLQELGLTKRFKELDDDTVWTSEDRAIYRQISKMDRTPRTTPDAPIATNPEVLQIVKGNFDDWDRDNDTRLELGEVDLLMSGGFYGEAREAADTPETAAALAVVRRRLNLLQSANPHDGVGVSKHDLMLMEEASTDLLAQMKKIVGEDYSSYLSDAREMTKSGPMEQENITPLAIRQGVVGSCVLLSTLLSIPAEQLSAMIGSDSDGSYTLSFPDGSEETVHEPTTAERLFHARGEGLDRWPALFELAMAQKLYQEVKTEDGALRSAIDGIEPERAIRALTNNEADKRSLDELSVNEAREALKQLTSRDGPVICGSRPSALGDFISVEELQNGIENSHCYAVLGFDATNDIVTLRNPWGKGEWHFQESSDEGIFEMPTRDFYSSFRWVAGVAA